MKAFFTCLAVSLAISAAAAATTCNHSNAQPWPSSSDGGCNGNAACEALAAEGQCNSQTLIDGGDCVKRRSTGAGGSLQCSASEMCYLYTDGDALCINWSTGESCCRPSTTSVDTILRPGHKGARRRWLTGEDRCLPR